MFLNVAYLNSWLRAGKRKTAQSPPPKDAKEGKSKSMKKKKNKNKGATSLSSIGQKFPDLAGAGSSLSDPDFEPESSEESSESVGSTTSRSSKKLLQHCLRRADFEAKLRSFEIR